MVNNTNNISKTVANLLKNLSARNRDVLSRRFGLKTGRKETLESIGSSYNITRERVRQIEESSLANLAGVFKDSADVNGYVDSAKNIITGNGGIIKERELFKAFSGQDKDSVVNASLVFVLTLDKDLVKFQENDKFHSLWALNSNTLNAFKDATASLTSILKKTGKVVGEKDLYYLAQKNNVLGFSNSSKTLSEDEMAIAMTISKEFGKNIFNEVGLASWAEIKPKGVRDKAYLVLKKEGNPQHFGNIAKLINSAGFDQKSANVQTVHNELIKDDRFVLVGRGLYALSEWGYKSGTVKDVLVDILKNSSKPLSKTAILAKVMDTRMVKENTILLNLQDSKTFSKNDDGTYTLRG